jgi:hypothetical protein
MNINAYIHFASLSPIYHLGLLMFCGSQFLCLIGTRCLSGVWGERGSGESRVQSHLLVFSSSFPSLPNATLLFFVAFLCFI